MLLIAGVFVTMSTLKLRDESQIFDGLIAATSMNK